MPKDALSSYHARLRKVQKYLFNEIYKGNPCKWDRLADLNTLADIACMSPYHWHRIYSSMMGESIAHTVKRLRLHYASSRLIYSQDAISQIASEFGYASVASFSRAFNQQYQMPPARYRREGRHIDFDFNAERGKIMQLSKENQQVNIKKIEKHTLIGIAHVGDYMHIGEKFEHLFALLSHYPEVKESSLFKSAAVYFDDPTVIPSCELKSIAAVQLDAPLMRKIKAEHPELSDYAVADGEYAVLRYKGAYSELGYAYGWLYSDWIAQSERELSDQAVFEVYLNNPREVQPSELITEIHIPLKAVS